MAEDRSRLERSIEGGCRASATEPELLGETTGGLEVIENNRGQCTMQSWAGMSHELIPITRGIGTGGRKLMMDEGGMRRAPRRAFNETSEKETVGGR
jgi:hypothetical protein